MVQLRLIYTTAALLFAALPLVAATDPLQKPKQAAQLGSFTSQGCFRTKQGLKKQNDVAGADLSSASCGARCLEQNKPVFALGGDVCYCGEKYPPQVDILDDEKCGYKCKGNTTEACGSKNKKRFSVWNSGVKVDVAFAEKKSTSTGGATKTTTPTNSTSTPKSTKSTKKTNKPTTKSGKSSKTAKSRSATTSTTESTTVTSEPVTATVTTSSSNNFPSSTSAVAAASTTPNGVSRPLIGAGAAVLAAALAL